MRRFLISMAVGLVLIVASNIMGHYHGPFSIIATAVLPFIIVSAINYPLYKINFSVTVLWGYGVILLNDILIRKFAGGTHDQVGKAVIMVFSLFALALCTITMLVYAYRIMPFNNSIILNQRRLYQFLTVILAGVATVIFYFKFLIQV